MIALALEAERCRSAAIGGQRRPDHAASLGKSERQALGVLAVTLAENMGGEKGASDGQGRDRAAKGLGDYAFVGQARADAAEPLGQGRRHKAQLRQFPPEGPVDRRAAFRGAPGGLSVGRQPGDGANNLFLLGRRHAALPLACADEDAVREPWSSAWAQGRSNAIGAGNRRNPPRNPPSTARRAMRG